jgi:lipopolysaccharide export system protein LptA
MNDKWIQTMENMKTQYLKGAKEEYRLPKVRVVLNDKKQLKTSEDKVIYLLS